MSFKPVQKLDVCRTLSDGTSVAVGVLAQNRQGVFFQYDSEYLQQFGNLSPFTLNESVDLQRAPRSPHDGLHGVFADSLPDGWGLLLQDRVFRQHDILPAQITAMDRLAFVGSRGMGALTFAPVANWQQQENGTVDLSILGLEAQALFDGQTDDVLAVLVAVGSSGGARPKAQLYFHPDNPQQCRTYGGEGDDPWLVKFTSKSLALGHEEGLCEAVYLQLAEQADLQPPEFRLLDAPQQSGARAWLAVKRFDCTEQGKLHMHSACGLLDADFRMPSLDYEDLIKASRQLCRSPAAGQLQFRRAIFNLLASNQDDHSKNWAFLQDDQGHWSLAPFYDVTFSPHPFAEHATSFAGFGKQPSLKSIQKLAASAGYSNWKQAQLAIQEIAEVLSGFAQQARQQGVSSGTTKLISETLEQRLAENKHLMQVKS